MDRFGWTPAEVRAISLAEVLEILTVIDVVERYHARPKPPPKKVNAA